jgi:hypothetical protein
MGTNEEARKPTNWLLRILLSSWFPYSKAYLAPFGQSVTLFRKSSANICDICGRVRRIGQRLLLYCPQLTVKGARLILPSFYLDWCLANSTHLFS